MKPRRLLLGLVLIALIFPCAVAQETATAPLAVTPAEQTAEWAKSWWMPRHEQKLADMKKQGTVDLLMVAARGCWRRCADAGIPGRPVTGLWVPGP